jgi:hypothetical protein
LTPDPAQTAADLRAAADYIELHGWTKNRYYDQETGAVCAAGALSIVTSLPSRKHWGERFAAAQAVFLDYTGLSLSGFNDIAAFDVHDVTRTLREVAQKVETELGV